MQLAVYGEFGLQTRPAAYSTTADIAALLVARTSILLFVGQEIP